MGLTGVIERKMHYPEQAMREESSELVPLTGNPTSASRRTLFGLQAEALAAVMVKMGEPAWRGKQLVEALYQQRVAEICEITTLSKSLRQRLADEGWEVGRPGIVQTFQSSDGTERYLIECGDGKTVETVWMPEGDDGESGDGSEAETAEMLGDHEPHPAVLSMPTKPGAPGLDSETGEVTVPRRAQKSTLCVSSQVGCAVNCQFCLTAKLGLQRNLTAGEIAGQVLAAFDRHGVEVGRDRVNLVFMGMGEPFLNYDNFMAAVRLLVREVGLSPRRMTVSTSGIVPVIEKFAREPLDVRPRLAISLNAPNDTIRTEIMPINRKWPINEVIAAVRRVPLRPRERVTFEYVLLGGVTDRPEHAREVARLVRRSGLPAKVNLIAWNPGPGIAYATPSPEAVAAFHKLLIEAGITAYIRQPRGRDIFAACGQLKRTVEE